MNRKATLKGWPSFCFHADKFKYYNQLFNSPEMTKECRLAIKVLPRTANNAIAGWENDELKVRLRAVPEKGGANRALIAFLAEVFHVPKSSIDLIRGKTSRHKLLIIRGLDPVEMDKLLETALKS